MTDDKNKVQDKQTAPPDPKKFQKEVEAKVNETVALLRAYRQINKDADEGKIIRGERFLTAEKRFDDHASDYEKKKASPISGVGALPKSPDDETYQSIDKWVEEKLNKIVDDDLASGLDTEPLDRAFVREYLNSPAYTKDTRLDPSVRTEAELLQAVLKKNRGFALGDMHAQDECCTLLTKNMAMLKASGVDTIYTEKPIDEEWSKLSAAELRSIAEKREYKGVKFYTAEEDAKFYHVKNADDITVADLKMLAAAKDHGVRIVPMDKPGGPARNFETIFMSHRFSSTNFVWTDNIEADRRVLAEQGNKDGKFVVLGGVVHFMSVRKDSDKVINGMVDEALGIPLLTYDNADKNKSPAFRIATNPNGPDFYLSGGTDYGTETIDWPLDKSIDPLKSLKTPPAKKPADKGR